MDKFDKLLKLRQQLDREKTKFEQDVQKELQKLKKESETNLQKKDDKIIKLTNKYKFTLKEIKKEELRKNDEEAQLAIYKNDLSKLLKINEEHYMVPSQRVFLEELIKPVNKLLSFSGFFEESREISIKLKLIEFEFNKNQIEKILPIIEKIYKNLTPISIHQEINEKFKVFPILDKYNGEKGSYSLLIDKNNVFFVYCENKMKPYFLFKTNNLKDILTYIAKKHFYYGI